MGQLLTAMRAELEEIRKVLLNPADMIMTEDDRRAFV